MLSAVLTLGIAGLVFGGFLALAAQRFKVEEDPRVAEILAALPGANCGACGFPGCAGLAEAVARGELPATPAYQGETQLQRSWLLSWVWPAKRLSP